MTDEKKLDIEVAEKVMGWQTDFILPEEDVRYSPQRRGVKHLRDHENNTLYLPDQWNPSTNHEDMATVLNRVANLIPDTFCINISGLVPGSGDVPHWECSFGELFGEMIPNDTGGIGDNMPEAVCRAALKLVEALPRASA